MHPPSLCLQWWASSRCSSASSSPAAAGTAAGAAAGVAAGTAAFPFSSRTRTDIHPPSHRPTAAPGRSSTHSTDTRPTATSGTPSWSRPTGGGSEAGLRGGALDSAVGVSGGSMGGGSAGDFTASWEKRTSAGGKPLFFTRRRPDCESCGGGLAGGENFSSCRLKVNFLFQSIQSALEGPPPPERSYWNRERRLFSNIDFKRFSN